jgi:cell division protein FtsL
MTKVKRAGAKRSSKKKEQAKSKRSRGLDFGFFVLVCVLLAGIGVFILVEHQHTVTSELKRQKIEKKIAGEKTKQETLRIKLARLKSPARVSRIAQDELGMVEPGGVIYLRYKRDSNGKIVCRSSYEKRSQEAHQNQTGDEPGSPGEEQDRSITQR